MNPQRSIRLTPNDTDFLSAYSFDNGDIYYDQDQKTLVVYDGRAKAGFPLLRADLANIAGGGGGGAGTINFGAKTLQASAFIGDGSQLTNLPLPPPPDLTSYATKTYADTAVSSALGNGVSGQLTYYTGANQLDNTGSNLTWDGNTLTVSNLTVTTNLNASITLTQLGFPQGVTVNEFSTDGTLAGNSNSVVPVESAVKTYVDTAIGGLDLSASGTVNNGTAGQLAFYSSTGIAVSGSGTNLTWNTLTQTLSTTAINASASGTFGTNLTVGTRLAVGADATVTGNVVGGNLTAGNSAAVYNTLTVGSNAIIAGDIRTTGSVYSKRILDTSTGVPKFTSGSDFVIDAQGEVNVSGSIIANVGTPTRSTDAATKAYVDSAASAFAGGDVAGAIRILNTTPSSSTTTGSLIVGGGLGVGEDIYAAGIIYSNGSPVLTSVSGGYNGGTISGTLYINNSTASTSSTTGALRVAGGVGINGVLNTGGDAFHNGIRFGVGAVAGSGFDSNVVIGGGTPSPFASNVGGQQTIAIGHSVLSLATGSNDSVAIGFRNMANRTVGNNNTSVGSLAMLSNEGSSNTSIGFSSMGAGTAGDFNTGLGQHALYNVLGGNNTGVGSRAGYAITTGNNNVILGSNEGTSIATFDNYIIISDGSGNIRAQWDDSGNQVHAGSLTITNITASTNSLTGALVVSGGVGIAGAINTASSITTAGIIAISDTTASSSTTTGALQVAGGVGVVGSVYAQAYYGDGSNLSNITAATFAGGTVAGATYFANTTASSSSSTGAVRVAGGVGVTGAINVGSSGNFGTTLTAGGIVSFTNNSAATSTTTGTLRVTGGMGVTGNVYAAAFYGDGSNLTGTAATTSNAVLLTADNTTNAVRYPLFSATATGSVSPRTDTGFTYNPSTGALTSTTFVGALSGNATTATSATTATNATVAATVTLTADNTTNATNYPLFVNAATGSLSPRTDTGFTYNPSTGVLTSTTFSGALSGNATTATTAAVANYSVFVAQTDGTGALSPIQSITTSGSRTTVLNPNTYAFGIFSEFKQAATVGATGNYAGVITYAPYSGTSLSTGDPSYQLSFAPSSANSTTSPQLRLRAGIDTTWGTWNTVLHTGLTAENVQFNSIGVGTAASGTAGEIRATNEVTAYYASDRDLKENIVPIDNALGKLRELTGVMFDWTDEELARRGGEDGYFVRKHDTGVIAQDVEQVLPEVVATRPDGHKAVRYEKMAGLIIQAINELADQVEEIKKKLG